MPTRHLITFIGGRPPKSTLPREYRKAVYQFPDGRCSEETPLFAPALLKHLDLNRKTCDRLCFIGTSTSMWEVLALELLEDDDLALALCQEELDAAQLQVLREGLSAKLRCEVELRLVPFGRDRAEQLALLGAVEQGVEEEDRLVLDVTHGFRHLGMVALLAAIYLRETRGVQIEEVWYGALDMTPGPGAPTPTLRLDALLDFADWSSAVAGFEATGDVSRLNHLLKREGASKELVEHLRAGAYFERSFRVGEAGRRFQSALPALERLPPGGLASRFRGDIRRALDWVQGDGYGPQQQRLARKALQHRDWLRAVACALEAWVTSALEDRGEHRALWEREVREQMREKLKDRPTFRQLNSVRNALVHSSQPSAWQARLPPDDDQMQRLLTKALEEMGRRKT